MKEKKKIGLIEKVFIGIYIFGIITTIISEPKQIAFTIIINAISLFFLYGIIKIALILSGKIKRAQIKNEMLLEEEIREELRKEKDAKWGGELRKHFSKERCSQTAMPFFAVFELYFGLFLSPVQNQMHR